MIDYTQGSNKQYHTQLSESDVGEYVILTGDPGRVKDIASYLDNAELVANNREYVTYTGYLNGVLCSVISTGIGGPSTAIAIEELVQLGCHTFLRVGTCGGMHLEVQGGDIVIASGAIRQDGTTREYAPLEFPAVPHYDVLSAQVHSAKTLHLSYHVGVVQSKDSFFGQHAPESMPVCSELENKWDAYCKLDCLASEMESSTVFIVSQTRHVRSGAMFLCLANQEREKTGLTNVQNHDLHPLMQCAVSTIKELMTNDKAENH